MKKEKINFIDLFCGAGGISCGLEMAGLNCIFGNDYNEEAVKTFAHNHKNAKSFAGDIQKLTKEKLVEYLDGNKVHLVVGGPPCQGFSTAGKGDPKDDRNSLFNYYCDVIKYVKPDFFIFENVTGIIATKNQKVLDTILKRFNDMNYTVIAQVLESQHYGVPQRRKRAILLGTRLDKKLSFPIPTHDTTINGKYVLPRTLGDALNEIAAHKGILDNNETTSAQIVNKLERERIKHIPEGRGIRYKSDEDELLPKKLKLNVDWETVRENRLRELILRRLDRKLPAPTINTKNHTYYHPTETRKFTARELASMQSFPLDFKFSGKRTSQIKQIGNAVPPLMAKALGEKIIEIYKSKGKSDKTNKISVEEIRKGAFIYSERKKSKGLTNAVT